MDINNKSLIVEELIKLFPQPLTIHGEILNNQVSLTLSQCLEQCLKEKLNTEYVPIFEITTVLDYLHDELNTGHWSQVPLDARRNFTLATFVKLILLLQDAKEWSNKIYQECVKCVDMGLLLGAPLEENPELLAECAQCLRNKVVSIEDSDPIIFKALEKEMKSFTELPGVLVLEDNIPSLEKFNKDYFKLQVPVKLKGCMKHWPALTKWLDLNYLLNLAGSRTVPVEIGSHYTDENWSQKLMTLQEFITNYFLSDDGDVGYLAQHNLFEQIIELKEDIRVPEYCCLSMNYEESTEPDVNAWFGPKGTISPLHQDPKNNLLAQVFGSKQVLLYSHEDTNFIYPYQENMLCNTAQVDPIKPDFVKYPEFNKAKMYKCLLEPGEMLFIPVKWWHHVTALDKSFSVSFWWQ